MKNAFHGSLSRAVLNCFRLGLISVRYSSTPVKCKTSHRA